MKEEIVKQGVKLAEEELKEKQIQEVKQIVLKTLEQISKVDKDITSKKELLKKLEEKKKILRMDIDDLKEGRLDRISERQEKDPEAKQVSVVLIIKETVIEREKPVPYWYQPYTVTWNPVYVQYPPIVFGISNTLGSVVGGYSLATNSDSITYDCSINSSVAKFATIGTYTVDGSIINLR